MSTTARFSRCEKLFGDATSSPVIPIFINSVATPLGPLRRVRALGAAVGTYLATLGKRVLVVGSGGLSHDPPVPTLATAPPAALARIVHGEPMTTGAAAGATGRGDGRRAPFGGVAGGATIAAVGLAPALALFGAAYFVATTLPALLPQWREIDHRPGAPDGAEGAARRVEPERHPAGVGDGRNVEG